MKQLNLIYTFTLYFYVCFSVYGQVEVNSLVPPGDKIYPEDEEKQKASAESLHPSKEVPEKTKQVSENLEADIKKYNQDYQILSSYFQNFKNTQNKTYNETKVQEKILERTNEKIIQENNKTLSQLNTKYINTPLNLNQVEMVGAEDEKVLSKVGKQKLKTYFNNLKKEAKNEQSTNPFAAVFIKELMFKKGEIDFDNIFVRLISAFILVACDNCFTYTGNYELEFKIHVPDGCKNYEYESENTSSENSLEVDKVDKSSIEKNGDVTKDSSKTTSAKIEDSKDKSTTTQHLKYDTHSCILSETKNKTKVHDIKIIKIVKSEAEAGKYKKANYCHLKEKLQVYIEKMMVKPQFIQNKFSQENRPSPPFFVDPFASIPSLCSGQAGRAKIGFSETPPPPPRYFNYL